MRDQRIYTMEAIDKRGGRLPTKHYVGQQAVISAAWAMRNPNIYKVSVYVSFDGATDLIHVQTSRRPSNCPWASDSACDVLADLEYRSVGAP